MASSEPLAPPVPTGAVEEPYEATFLANMWRGPEAVGGKLKVSNTALVFDSHALNVQTGRSVIPITEIIAVAPAKTFLIVPNRLDVTVRSGERFSFVVAGRDRAGKLIAAKAGVPYPS